MASKALGWFGAVRLALRLLGRDMRAGELRLMAVSLLLAVASFTTVAFFADRVKLALSTEAAQLLGADLVVVSDHPIDATLRAEARRLGLALVDTVRFPSMVVAGDASLLTEIKAVTPGYPLKGRLRFARADGGMQEGQAAPAPGEAWLDERVLARLGVALGDSVRLGNRELRVAARLVDDPDRSIGFLNVMPRLMLNERDLPATGLITIGSRVTYRLMLAGSRPALAAFRDFASLRVTPGQRVEDVRDARPEIRSALERAEKFLGLASLLSVILASVAIALAARRYLQRHLDNCAMLRCLGASRALTVWLHALQLSVLGLVAGLVGCAAGFAAQWGLASLLAPLVQVSLPAPSLLPALQGMTAGFVLLLGFALPPLVALGRVPTLRVLRRDLGPPGGMAWVGYAAGVAAVAALILWQTRDLKLAGTVLGGLAVAIVVSGLAAWGLVGAAAAAGRRAGFAWRFGLANLSRRALGSVVQVVALGAGLLALILLSITRGDMLETWKRSLPPDAPNRFLVNIQPDQIDAVAQFFADEGRAAPKLYPMVRGRLTAINGRAISSADYGEDRARRLVDREFNLSWARTPQVDNVIVAGRWWGDAAPAVPEFSVEEGIAEALRIRLGDRLTYDVAGSELQGAVTSLRKVEWDSFRVNFFVVAPPGMLDGYPASYVTSFHLPQADATLLDRLVKRFPNVLVVDVAAVLAQVQAMMDQVVRAVEFVFLFSVGAGLLVLFAAIQSTHEERVREAAILRTLGGSTAQLAYVQAAEFLVVGALAGLLAAIGATALGWVLARQVLDVPYEINPVVWLVGLVTGSIGVLLAGLIGTRRVLRATPMDTLRRG
ncbi:MAG: FtsX-like permease family protein [Betaproteobacteria bacterium]